MAIKLCISCRMFSNTLTSPPWIAVAPDIAKHSLRVKITQVENHLFSTSVFKLCIELA